VIEPLLEADARPRRRITLVILAALAAVLMAGFLSLGMWQMHRLGWKQDLIARVEARLSAPAMPIPPPDAWATITPEQDEYRKVTVTGQFDHTAETLVQAVTERGAGFWVMTPLRAANATYLINRGFVPTDHSDPDTRRDGQPAGQVSVTGLIRLSEPNGGFLRDNDPAQGRWYSRDVTAISARLGLKTAPFFVDAAQTSPFVGAYPIGGLTVVAFRNTHLSYALTWFCLAIGTAAAAFLVGRHEWRHRRAWLKV
jgi:surfeit locus 1 family protein